MASYSMLVTAARFSRGLSLGSRMALISGGAWGAALGIYYLMVWIVDAEILSLQGALNFCCGGLLLAAIMGLCQRRSSVS